MCVLWESPFLLLLRNEQQNRAVLGPLDDDELSAGADECDPFGGAANVIKVSPRD